MAELTPEPSQEREQGRSVVEFLTDKAFPLATSLFIAISAWLTVVSVSATSEKAELEDALATVERRYDEMQEQYEELRSSNSALTDRVATLRDERDRFRAAACEPSVTGFGDSASFEGYATCTFGEAAPSPPTSEGRN
jgi:hypothetical protein